MISPSMRENENLVEMFNSVARSVIENCRGRPAEYVLGYRENPAMSIRSSAFSFDLPELKNACGKLMSQ